MLPVEIRKVPIGADELPVEVENAFIETGKVPIGAVVNNAEKVSLNVPLNNPSEGKMVKRHQITKHCKPIMSH